MELALCTFPISDALRSSSPMVSLTWERLEQSEDLNLQNGEYQEVSQDTAKGSDDILLYNADRHPLHKSPPVPRLPVWGHIFCCKTISISDTMIHTVPHWGS